METWSLTTQQWRASHLEFHNVEYLTQSKSLKRHFCPKNTRIFCPKITIFSYDISAIFVTLWNSACFSSSSLLLDRVPLQRRAGSGDVSDHIHVQHIFLCIPKMIKQRLLALVFFVLQVLLSEEDLKLPKELHPIFYGCFDWHRLVLKSLIGTAWF